MDMASVFGDEPAWTVVWGEKGSTVVMSRSLLNRLQHVDVKMIRKYYCEDKQSGIIEIHLDAMY